MVTSDKVTIFPASRKWSRNVISFMTPAEFVIFAQTRHGEKWIQPMADETGYSYAQIYGIAKRGRPVGKRLEKIVANLTPIPSQ